MVFMTVSRVLFCNACCKLLSLDTCQPVSDGENGFHHRLKPQLPLLSSCRASLLNFRGCPHPRNPVEHEDP